MSGADFLDTDVLVYAYEIHNPDKERTAQDLIRRALGGEFVISAQVLSELASTLLHKASPRATPAQMITILDQLALIRLVAIDAGVVRRAVEAQERYGLHFYDGMIVAAAERARCGRILSEDFNAGQEYFGVTAANPFD